MLLLNEREEASRYSGWPSRLISPRETLVVILSAPHFTAEETKALPHTLREGITQNKSFPVLVVGLFLNSDQCQCPGDLSSRARDREGMRAAGPGDTAASSSLGWVCEFAPTPHRHLFCGGRSAWSLFFSLMHVI